VHASRPLAILLLNKRQGTYTTDVFKIPYVFYVPLGGEGRNTGAPELRFRAVRTEEARKVRFERAAN
jgi:hypothetical protein